ncbi:Glu-tRNA(Gln) amidotransferase subunit GatD [Candidatus Woesearchaeota archaeon]|nr:Glu-tRNA(Gln) amidotransferase subunit GatD [Candidatus Woesearchaeota archaeon]
MDIGDKVRVEMKDNVFEGVLMPSSGNIVVKLSSGYNVGLDKKEIKNVKVLEKHKEKISKSLKLETSKGKKNITILHTGGTIASKVDYETGAVIARYTPEEIVTQFPELNELANINSRLISNMFSEDMRFSNYNTLAKEIEKEIKNGTDGIVITHGTDTLHYTSAALSFILEGLNIPVILVGAQRSSDRGSSDAAMNLICAVEFILKTEFAEVGVCMHKVSSDDICWLLPGLKCRKLHSSRRDAFRPVNAKQYAEINYNTKIVQIIDNSFRPREKRELKLKLFKEVKVGILKSKPNMFVDELKIYSKYDGLILEGTGLGHMPIDQHAENKEIFNELKKLAKKIPVVMTTQTLFGRVNMNVYSNGKVLKDIGILGDQLDLSAETAYIKLAWLLSNHPEHARIMMHENLRGELNNRIMNDFI